MRIVKSDGIYKASRIAGPRHNYLGLAIASTSPAQIQFVQRRLQEGGDSQIDETKLLTAVSEGVMRANRELGVALFVERIEYVPTDTSDYSTYADLAKAIVCSASGDFA